MSALDAVTVTPVPSAFQPAGKDPLPSMPLVEALAYDWASCRMDTHLAQYGRAPGDPCPRLRKDMLGVATANKVTLNVVFVDLDCPGHAPWPGGASDPAAVRALDELVDRAYDAGFPMGGYTSRAGLRLVLALSPVAPLDKARSIIATLEPKVRKALGDLAPLGVEWDDQAAGQWHRIFRAPRVFRDGKALEPVLVLPTEAFDPTPLLAKAAVETVRAKVCDQAEVRAVRVHPDSWVPWVNPASKAGKVLTELTAGEALPYPEGARNSSLLGVVRSLSAQLFGAFPVADDLASVLYSICAPSVAADLRDGSPTLDELRRMATTVAPYDAPYLQPPGDER